MRTRGCQAFEAGGNIDAVAIDLPPVFDDVAEIDADAELDAPFGRHNGVALGHLELDIDRTAHRVDDACELDQEAVARGSDDAATALYLPFTHDPACPKGEPPAA
jgi:hypothetical protein